MQTTPLNEVHPVRRRVVQGLSLVEDVVYVSLGVLLTIAAFTLVFSAFRSITTALHSGQMMGQIISVLDQVLLTLLIIELLYTVQVSFREHGLLAEPFLVVALIAAIRRILVLTAKFAELPDTADSVFRHAFIELGVLTVMIVVLVGSLIALQRHKRRGGED
jgi:uncharacterized membrane protein (DUF373 family)